MSTPAVSRAFNRQLDNLNELLVMCEHGRTAMDEALAKGQVRPLRLPNVTKFLRRLLTSD